VGNQAALSGLADVPLRCLSEQEDMMSLSKVHRFSGVWPFPEACFHFSEMKTEKSEERRVKIKGTNSLKANLNIFFSPFTISFSFANDRRE